MPKLTQAQQKVAALMQSWGYTLTEAQLAAVVLAAKPQKDETELQKMTNAMLQVSRWPQAKFPRALRAAQAMLKEGKTPDEVILHYGFKDPGPSVWWWRRRDVDFRNRNGADPTPDIILETCKKWEASPMKDQITAQAAFTATF